MRYRERNTAVLLVLAVALSACKPAAEEKTSPSQVIARVGDAEITVHQLNFLLAQQPAAASPTTKQQILDGLIDQELLVQKAVTLKLDRDPNVVQAIDAARRQILARAAAEREFGKAQPPTQAQIDAFIADNPLLFSERRRYEFEVFAIAHSALKPEQEAMLDQSKSPKETIALLQKAGIAFQQSDTQKNAEQVPMALLPQIAAMHVGDITSLAEGDKLLLLQLKSASPAPLDGSQSAESVKHYLQSNRVQTQVATRMKALHDTTKIEYLQRFASATAAVQPVAQQDVTDASIKAGLKGLQ
ncbi:hypothetical protein IGB42_00465 [Andreprevotia sp. IGB-42]|uniref:EpsD family peptidyl-prolyl cis-trans isomerase n=1 Tax=Andreprevotia sp. IGB-42 TaxID=2497473 RepID=UPI00135A300B|nr:EpsD family peptidyl-prolyl cis-trans isomerase [Andreprevotia sp. IGB-42]KAF0815384.1 hypothetical protein IGB42_00465 [Andreprevotia sp. IGB-42]